MILNNHHLLQAAPIKGMTNTKHREHGVSYGLSEAGYDIRIKQQVHFKEGWVSSYTPEEHHEMFVPKWQKGRFCIASAIQEFDVPNHLVGIVHDKSTWARKGLSVFNTVIEPGWKGFLTLELVYHGHEELIIPAGCGIAQVIFHELSSPSAYEGKYQNQEDRPIAARES